MANTAIKNIVIVGSSSHALLSAVTLAIGLKKQANIIIINTEAEVESEVFYGSGHFVDFHRNLGINLNHLIQQGDAVSQSAERYINFFDKKDLYIGNDISLPMYRGIESHHVDAWLNNGSLDDFSYAVAAAKRDKFVLPSGKANHVSNSFEVSLQIKTLAYINFMAGAAKQLGVQYVTQKIKSTTQNTETGFIESIILADGRKLDVDLIIDSTVSGEIYQHYYEQAYNEVTLPIGFNRMVERKCLNNKKVRPYSTKIATKYGLIEQATFNSNTILRYFYNETANKVDVLNDFDNYFPESHSSIFHQYHVGEVSDIFYKNCLCLGNGAFNLGYSFIPLVNFSVRVLSKLLDYFPNKACPIENIRYLNQIFKSDIENIKLFNELCFYNLLSQGESSLSSMALSKQAQQKVNLFLSSGKVCHQLNPIIVRQKWINLLSSWYPNYKYEPVLDSLSKESAIAFLEMTKASINKLIS